MLRTSLGFSQEDFAHRLGITRQTISAFENRQRQIPWSMFLAMLTLFTASPDTRKLLYAMEIYTQELEMFLIISE